MSQVDFIRFNCMLLKSDLEKLKELAKMEAISVSHLVRIAIRKHLEEKNGKESFCNDKS